MEKEIYKLQVTYNISREWALEAILYADFNIIESDYSLFRHRSMKYIQIKLKYLL